jgi:hypothetical protein
MCAAQDTSYSMHFTLRMQFNDAGLLLLHARIHLNGSTCAHRNCGAHTRRTRSIIAGNQLL